MINFKDAVASTLSDAAKRELRALPGYEEASKVLAGWSPAYTQLIEIGNNEPEPGDAATDFSREAIQRRRRSSYRDVEIGCRSHLH